MYASVNSAAIILDLHIDRRRHRQTQKDIDRQRGTETDKDIQRPTKTVKEVQKQTEKWIEYSSNTAQERDEEW